MTCPLAEALTPAAVLVAHGSSLYGPFPALRFAAPEVQLRPWNTDHSPATSDEQGTHASCLTLASTVVHASVGAFFVRL